MLRWGSGKTTGSFCPLKTLIEAKFLKEAWKWKCFLVCLFISHIPQSYVEQGCRLLHWWVLYQIKRLQSSLILMSKIIGFVYSASIMLHFEDLVNSILCQVLCLKIVGNSNIALRSEIRGLDLCVIKVFHGQLNSSWFVDCDVLNLFSEFHLKVIEGQVQKCFFITCKLPRESMSFAFSSSDQKCDLLLPCFQDVNPWVLLSTFQGNVFKWAPLAVVWGNRRFQVSGCRSKY